MNVKAVRCDKPGYCEWRNHLVALLEVLYGVANLVNDAGELVSHDEAGATVNARQYGDNSLS